MANFDSYIRPNLFVSLASAIAISKQPIKTHTTNSLEAAFPMELPPPTFLFAAIQFFFLLLPTAASAPYSSSNLDLESLLAFKAHVVDPYGILTTNWTTNTSFCSWIGVSCSRRRQRVTAIRIRDSSLGGTISPHISNLSFLSYLNLQNNSMTGPIPPSLGRLPRLTYINLQGNSLSGPIPSTILNMSSLISLSVASNNLSGSLHENNNNISLVMLPRLQQVSLSSNHLTGDAALLSFARCRDLQLISLASNQFTGSIPAEIGSLPKLTRLYLADNRLTGTIPTSLGNLTMLAGLDLSTNRLEGVIPEELGNLQNLRYLSVGNNSLGGSIPKSLLNFSMLYNFDLSQNMITGNVPVLIGKSLPLLEWFHVGSNQLTGGLEFLSSFSNCKHLEYLDVSENKLEGVLQDSIRNLSASLQVLSASENRVNGNIPAGLGNLTGLVQLFLYKNELTGTIPSAVLAGLEGLQLMNLAFNRISGSIPFEFGLMTNLNMLILEDNALSGSIPDSMANISRIQRLSFNKNKLSSSIPDSLWTLESLLDLDLSMNAINGSLSSRLGSLKALDTLDLSMNRLSGNIPGALGKLQMLTYLDISKNSFQGEIPESLGGLISVTYLNLSRNFLSGVIPKSIANLTYLERLDLSFNKLEGGIPKGRIFSNLSISSLMGNEALCGAPQLQILPCSTNIIDDNSRRKNQQVKYILIATGVVLFTCICLLCIFYWKMKMMKKKKNKNLASTNEMGLDNYRVVSHHELVRATANFADANLLGRGAFGSVFRGCLDDGLIVAVKVLNLEVEGALKSFDAECQALKMVRHRNLIKIISVCSNLDFKALVLQFMPNGSLEDWLHFDNHCLNLLQRVSIMVDVSLAVEYLHHHHPNIVLHCDLKPSNVLLDEEMAAHVSDFGISKLLHADSRSITSTSTQGTIGYIAPEYAFTGAVSKMGDVYSFGILLLETFTRRRPSDAMFGEESNLREWVHKAHPVSVLHVVDHNLLKNHSNNEGPSPDLKAISSIIELGLLCSRYSPKERIPMTDVVVRLQKIKMEYLSTAYL